MAENTKGRRLLTDRDFVEVVGADGEDLPSVPKHWGEDQLPAGASFKKSASKAAAKKTAAKKTAAKKTAAASTSQSGDDSSGDDGSGDSGSSE